MMEQVHDPGGKKMMQGHQGMMVHGNKDWRKMIQESDNIVKNMNQVIEQMHNLMSNEKMMMNPQLKHPLEKMKSDMSSVMESMNSFLDNAEEVQKIQGEKTSKKSN
jgi:seryl-tRNA synthetase